ncbi:MAG TPA: hypothetical protein VN672_08415 [Solirubrobacteraceae bacterium]|nr:hypothetical protein [Solirubrobacteraceae bacterium]
MGTRGARTARRGIKRRFVPALALVALAAALTPGAASAGTIKEELAPFANCPLETPGVAGCVVALTTGGQFTIGNSTVPITRTVTLQGGTVPPSLALAPPRGGEMLSKTPLPVPGGLLGIELLGNLTEVTATAELTSPPEFGELVTLPVKVKLDNPLLGASCYIGSDSEPIVMNLTGKTTNPPPPNEPITGSGGVPDVKFGGRLVKSTNTSLVDNAFAVGGANGCAGVLAPIVDPSVNLKEGLPAAAGHNTAILNGTLELATAELVRDPPPEFGRCVKVAKGTGKFHNSGCTAHEPGSYEWVPGVVKSGFTTAGGATKLETVGKSKVACAAESGGGKYSGTKNVTAVSVRFTGCVGPNASSCSSAGAGAGELVSKALEGELGAITEGVIEGKEFRKVGLDLFPTGHTGPLFEFTCGGSAQVITGSVIAAVSSGKTSVSGTESFKASKGRQVPERFEGEPVDVLRSSIAGGANEQAGLTVKLTRTSEEAVEINPIA